MPVVALWLMTDFFYFALIAGGQEDGDEEEAKAAAAEQETPTGRALRSAAQKRTGSRLSVPSEQASGVAPTRRPRRAEHIFTFETLRIKRCQRAFPVYSFFFS